MDDPLDRFQEKLAALEGGEPLETCLEGMEADQVELLQLAASLRGFQPPPRKQAVVETQLAHIVRLAVKQPARKRATRTRYPWFLPLAAAGSAVVLLIACLSVFGLVWGISRSAFWPFDRLDQAQASVGELRGLVELQAKDGAWTPVSETMQLKPGARLRTGVLSSALLTLEDGSQLRLGPRTELALTQMDRSTRGVRVIRITQWHGEISHRVMPMENAGSLYEVRTSTATSIAQGTSFTVQVDPQLGTRVEVLEGSVDVTGMDAMLSRGLQGTVPVSAGKVTTVSTAQPPTDPAFLVSGEGILTSREGAWTIAGQAIVPGQTTQVIGDAETGDLVAFEARQLPDGTLQVDRLESIMSPAENGFRLTSQVEAIAGTALVAADTLIGINGQTSIADGVTPGETATVEGVNQADGSWLATRVYTEMAGQPFQFTGVVQSMGTERWVISGLEIAVAEDTRIEPGIVLGDIVQVQGWIQAAERDIWLAGAIQSAPHVEAYFDFAGTVQGIDPWVVAGITLETRSWTSIDPGIEPGDQARVRGPILADGTWVAAAIDKIDEEPGEVTLEFVGTVNSTDPWVVSGIPLVVDTSTQITGQVEVGSLVEVRATRQSNGTWHADEIRLIVPGSPGCVTYASVVIAIQGNILTLQDGSTIDLNEVETIEGEIEVESVILIVKCMASDGTITYPLIKVLLSPPGAPTPTSTPTWTPTVTSTPPPQTIILPNCYQITFLGFTDHGDGTSTWRYLVEELSCAQDLSNWVLELPVCARVIDASPSPWEEVHPDPNHHLNGIKWEVGAGFQSGEFSVVLAGDLTLGITQVGAKGPDVAIGSIAGPACDVATATPSPTPTTTMTPSAQPPSGTPTVTLTQTNTPTPTDTLTPLPTDTPTPAPPTATFTPAPPPPTDTPAPPAPPPPSSGPIVITESNQTLTITCSGNSVMVNGNGNALTLLGTCSSLTIRGNANRVFVQMTASITVSGNANQVFWENGVSGPPSITNTGNGNSISQR